jgi:tripartite motif-containing protein 71
MIFPLFSSRRALHRRARRKFAFAIVACFGAACLGGCRRAATTNAAAVPQAPQWTVWGERGARPGEFTEPRALAASPDGFVYVVDTTGRIQKLTTNGKYVSAWRSPKLRYDQPEGPEGIVVLPNGNIAFTNTHDSKVLIYSPQGKLIRTFGAYGTGRGQFLLVTGICADREGFIYAADYGGEFDRVSKWTQNGRLVASWNGHGDRPRQFRRPCGLAISIEGDLLVADINNHRIQRLNRKTGAFISSLGVRGRGAGQLNYPYGVAVDRVGNIYVVEYGNHRVQKFSAQGKFLAMAGAPGRALGQFANPRGIAVDKDFNVYIADTQNHRVQKLHFAAP